MSISRSSRSLARALEHRCEPCELTNVRSADDTTSPAFLGLRPCALVRGWGYLIFRPGHHRLLEQLVMLTLRQSRRFLGQAHIRVHVSAPTFAHPFELSIHGHLSITTHGARSDNSFFAHLSTLEKRSYAACLLGNSRTCHSVEHSIRVHLSTFTHACSRAGTRVSDTFQCPYTTALRAKQTYCPFGQDARSIRKSLSTLTHVRSLE